MSFITSLWSEYPLPKPYSIWGGDSIVNAPVSSLDDLLDTCTQELASDILLLGFVEAAGMVTYLPEDAISVNYAMLSSTFPFQGNRLIKCTFDPVKHIAYLRFYPATISFYRKLRRSDLDVLSGDQLIYAKSYVLSKMATKELTILKSVNLQVDNGVIDLSVLSEFAQKMLDKYNALKPEILIYSTVN